MKKINRRQLLTSAFASATLVAVSGNVSAQTPPNTCKKSKTPVQPEGPFYPIDDQMDTDTDLIRVNGSEARALGEMIYVEGTVTDQNCNAVSGVLVEIWQACHSGRYNHPSDPNTAELDPNFQYWGKAVTNDKGYYKFRTIIPGAYPANEGWVRPPHIHFKVSRKGYLELITQMYFFGQELNDNDLILQRLSKAEQEKLVVPLRTTSFNPNEPTLIGTFNISMTKV